MSKTIDKNALDRLPCTQLRGVGPKLSEQLAKRSIHTIQDLLFHLPARYQDRTRVLPISTLKSGDHAVIEGVIKSSRFIPGRKPSFVCDLSDGHGQLPLRFFHFSMAQAKGLSAGTELRCFGEVRQGPQGLGMIHPEYHRVKPGEVIEVDEHLTPIYPTVEGLSQKTWRQLSDQALHYLSEGALLSDYLPEELLKNLNLPSLKEALHFVHRPPPDAAQALLEVKQHPMQQRLVFEELLAHQLSMKRLRAGVQAIEAPAFSQKNTLSNFFLENLPFELTGAQKRVVAEVVQDLQLSQPMLRLVQGDVGSGKTVVAALTILQAVENDFQAALMAPTEILAEQHYACFKGWMEPLDIKVVWLSGKMKAQARRSALEDLALGTGQIIIGTHALFQDEVVFAKLGAIVIDEQHRFGVHQRMALRDKASKAHGHPHQLIMTATPIPRTLAMTAYANLDVSVIDELPPGRQPVKTVVIDNIRRDEIIERIQDASVAKHQVYWVCTLIEESDVLQCQAAEATAKELSQKLPELTVGLVHGRMSSIDKEVVMSQFKAGDIDLLVATTVIEVGVDVPNATLMVIENAERLGLAQLHQLRGRVGRGSDQSHCVLLYQTPLSQQSKSRLGVMRDTNDGFEIAQKDLELRGPGEVLGVKQTGIAEFRIVDLMRDEGLLPKVNDAVAMLELDDARVDCLIQRWLGDREQYAGV